SELMSTDPPLSRASPLPQCFVCAVGIADKRPTVGFHPGFDRLVYRSSVGSASAAPVIVQKNPAKHRIST
ncbi:hypothetical protein ACW9JE_01890, partial [Pseudomonas sp. SDO55104_S430]